MNTKCVIVCLNSEHLPLVEEILERNSQENFVLMDVSTARKEIAMRSVIEFAAREKSTKIYLIGKHLNPLLVNMTNECLRSGIETFVVVDSVESSDWLKTMRIFHSGGICTELEDFISQYKLNS